MDNKNIFKIMLFMLLFVVTAYTAIADIATITITAPTASQSIGASYTFTGSYAGNGSHNGSISVGNISFFYNTSVLPASLICADTTLSTANTTFTCTGTLSGFAQDCTGHTMYAVVYNENGTNLLNATVTGIILDYTPPTISNFKLDRSTYGVYDTVKYSFSTTDNCAGTTLTSSALMSTPFGKSSNKTGTSGSFVSTILTSPSTGYSAIAHVTDSAGNNATRANISFSVSSSLDKKIKQEVTIAAVNEPIKQVAKTVNYTGTILLVVILLSLGGWYFYFRK